MKLASPLIAESEKAMDANLRGKTKTFAIGSELIFRFVFVPRRGRAIFLKEPPGAPVAKIKEIIVAVLPSESGALAIPYAVGGETLAAFCPSTEIAATD